MWKHSLNPLGDWENKCSRRYYTQQSWFRFLEHLFSALETQVPTEIIYHNTGLQLPSSALKTICGTKSGKCLLFACTPLDKGCFCCHQVTAVVVVESRENFWKWIVRPGYNIWQIQSVWKMWDQKHILWKFSLNTFWWNQQGSWEQFLFPPPVMGQRLFI